MKNEIKLTKKHFTLNECYDKDTGNSSIPASRRMLWNKIEQLKQERQKVIAELEEYIEEQPIKCTYDYNTYDRIPVSDEEFIRKYDLQQKLNEMKGE